MPTARWTEKERRTGFILQVVLGLSDQERKKYRLKDIRDEIEWRWSEGKRQAQWNTIDPEGGPDAAERANWMQTLGEIHAAAANSALRNFLLEDDDGNPPRPLAVIQIPTTLPSYQRDPNTHDSVFYKGHKRPPGRVSNASTQAIDGGKVVKVPKSAKAPTKKRPTTTMTSTEPENEGWFLNMIHRKWLVDEQAARLSVQPRWLEANGSPKHIYQESPVREFGGQVIRLYHPTNADTFNDMLVCQDQVCAWCTGTAIMDDACDAELVIGVDASQTPTKGLPFVHRGRDVSNLIFSARSFNPAAGFGELNVPKHTRKDKINCMAGSNSGLRAWRAVVVLGCVERRCGVCTPASGNEKGASPILGGSNAPDEDDTEGDEEGDEDTELDGSEESDYEHRPRKKRQRRSNDRKQGEKGRRGGRGGGSGGFATRKPGTVVAGPDKEAR
ncbi:hypothetical protein Slin15195_G100680 [Septoria linicola]|uniref:Uncharacterized protein n=1 Tax=Septoria linicola TaxID=215465 RepID=A0A9Q9AWJ3_9PEZI|nr:hypothetical protein Slin15195_G100680 [Septoria linicola]